MRNILRSVALAVVVATAAPSCAGLAPAFAAIVAAVDWAVHVVDQVEAHIDLDGLFPDRAAELRAAIAMARAKAAQLRRVANSADGVNASLVESDMRRLRLELREALAALFDLASPYGVRVDDGRGEPLGTSSDGAILRVPSPSELVPMSGEGAS